MRVKCANCGMIYDINSSSMETRTEAERLSGAVCPKCRSNARCVNHIVGFSGGIASAVMAKIVADKFPDTTILLYHSTNTEPADNDRFRSEVASYIGLPITEDSDGRDIWQVFDDERFLGSGRNTPCSRILKQERSLRYLKANQPAVIYIGFTLDEYRRAQRVFARYAKYDLEAKFPLIDQKITKEECMYRVINCWGITPPAIYSWAEHANCIPCVKGKKAYWGLIYMFERAAWNKANQAEKDFKRRIFTEGDGLEDELENCLRLAKLYLANKKNKESQMNLFEYPCECAV